VKNILFVGPIHPQGIGGRYEEMKIWAKSFIDEGNKVSIFSMFNSKYIIYDCPMYEFSSILFPTLFHNNFLNKYIIRVLGSKVLKYKRDSFYNSDAWYKFISSYDCVFLFITHFSKEMNILNLALDIPVFVRFTGAINNLDFFKYLCLNNLQNRSTNFIFHSRSLVPYMFHGKHFHYIDQTTLLEDKLLSIPIDGKVRVFGMIGLFMKVKQIEEIIIFFKNFPHLSLFIFGKGELENRYREVIKQLNISNVFIKDFISSDKLSNLYQQIDCLIINSSEESGPMIGIEAMAAGKLIISKPVGAMPDRLPNEKFVFNSIDELNNIINYLETLGYEEVFNFKHENRFNYLNSYSNSSLKNNILNLIKD
jgi:glycosyltransferase involved in cell wall biosynthesis